MLKISLICFLGCLLQSGATLPEQIFLIVCLFVVHLFCMCSVCCFVTEDEAMASKNSLATLLLLFVEEILFRGGGVVLEATLPEQIPEFMSDSCAPNIKISDYVKTEDGI